MVSKQIEIIKFRVCKSESCPKILLKWDKHPLCWNHRICPCSLCDRWGKDKLNLCKKHYETERPPPGLTYDSGQEGTNFVPVPGRGGNVTPMNNQGDSSSAKTSHT